MPFLAPMLYVAMAVTPISQDSLGYEWNKKSTLRTDRPVEFPGIVLQPGAYVVKLRESGERRSLIEILNEDETQVLASVVAVPDHRMRPEGESEFVFHEMKTPGPAPIQTWFYSGDLVGLEFVYSKARAREIAKQTDVHVMAFTAAKGGVIVAVTPNGKEIMIDDPAPAIARRKPQ
jgi:hypothetical protein